MITLYLLLKIKLKFLIERANRLLHNKYSNIVNKEKTLLIEATLTNRYKYNYLFIIYI